MARDARNRRNHWYNGRGTNPGDALWLPEAKMSKKQIAKEVAYINGRVQRQNEDSCTFLYDEETAVKHYKDKRTGEDKLVMFPVGRKCSNVAVSYRRDPETGASIRRCGEHL